MTESPFTGEAPPPGYPEACHKSDATARFHDGNFGSQIGNTIDVLTSANIDQSSTELLRIIALIAMSTHDAHANHWFWKYHARNNVAHPEQSQYPFKPAIFCTC